MQPEYVDG